MVRSLLIGSNVQQLAHVIILTHFGSHFLLNSNVRIVQRSSRHARLLPTWELHRACHNPSTSRFTQRKCNVIRRSSCVTATF